MTGGNLRRLPSVGAWSLPLEVCGAGKPLGFPIPIWLKGHCPVYLSYVVKALDILVSVFNMEGVPEASWSLLTFGLIVICVSFPLSCNLATRIFQQLQKKKIQFSIFSPPKTFFRERKHILRKPYCLDFYYKSLVGFICLGIDFENLLEYNHLKFYDLTD